MHPSEFAARWRTRASLVTEEQAYQKHDADVASLVGGPVPSQAGTPNGLTYQAAVYLPEHFICEARRTQKTVDAHPKILGEALVQATLYTCELGSTPLIVRIAAQDGSLTPTGEVRQLIARVRSVQA
ncbi:hypothetical protein [Deinococcus soli (ex Cha et al. 2016)]|uniref:hypothetical protein n=1 Tax=Deinococcus soli (ex Cha et al. 2016) TaxID=1309411 RepID=UPI001665DEF8|nr:hypothetical protein [Deinococcus soli (ex Cha et al. 2016)]GGB79081.1 hypothetical protein GCM10008019_39140 [Deinococcus soli (ex Cha et al. 2016)]